MKAFLTITVLALLSSSPNGWPALGSPNQGVLKIVQDLLLQRDNSYYVKGSIYNSSDKAANNVLIKYYIWKKWMGKDGHGSLIKETGGLVVAQIKFLPPKQTVDFVAVGGDNAPVMMHDVPDPLDAEISADWDQ
jgi:hypothetical protein